MMNRSVAMEARKASEIKLSSAERETVERYVRPRKMARSMAQRAEIILDAEPADAPLLVEIFQHWADSIGRRNGCKIVHPMTAFNASAGVLQSRAFRGRVFNA
jgi:hypothetical protein